MLPQLATFQSIPFQSIMSEFLSQRRDTHPAIIRLLCQAVRSTFPRSASGSATFDAFITFSALESFFPAAACTWAREKEREDYRKGNLPMQRRRRSERARVARFRNPPSLSSPPSFSALQISPGSNARLCFCHFSSGGRMQFSPSASSSQKEIFGIYNLGGALWEESHVLMAIRVEERGSIRRREQKKTK